VGTPMLLMGDEVRRTQRGNNNGYCQDNEISWFDWSLLEKHADIHRFVKTLIEMRHRRKETALNNLTLNQLLARARIEYHGLKLHQPDWGDQSHSLAISASPVAADLDLYLTECLLGTASLRVTAHSRAWFATVAVLVRYVS